ncbi:hypothetical protein GLOIN_2v1728575 [Rhizophagus clarus]|uniref:Uncharacterized protein n=1 Tax=Rhizophagus clarus TaxID=94130 RepID=A0A8H3R4L5_9GLOM|nr:hypothetical protein GLOIN_2v1728575 [Rhizophagus clarus]
MVTIIEKVDKCWNTTTKIERHDKITIYHEDIKDATDDVCTIISKWYNHLLTKYNEDLNTKDQYDHIGKLFKDKRRSTTSRLIEKSAELRLNKNELLESVLIKETEMQ